ncbi:MAG: transglutaminaseTgpA domain-containing protein [Chloroflexota bacterium]
MRITNYSASTRFFTFLASAMAVAGVGWTSRDASVVVIGILGTAAGHFYSWHTRFSPSRLRTGLLILFMAALGIYLSGAIISTGDRLLLARYLVYGLVIGSFDLPKRRNVMASLVLAGLLLVLIAEMALDLWFIVFILIFAVLAVAAVTLDRTEAETRQTVTVGELSWLTLGKAWLGLTIVTFLLAGVFFLMVPRLASVEAAQTSWLPSRLDLSLGGQARLPSKPSASPSSGIFPSQDGVSGERYASLGYIGSAADQAVMHVRSRISSYWRGLTLDEYDGQGWSMSPVRINLLDENRREFILPDSQQRLYGERVYWQAFYLLSDQPNAIFSGYKPARIYLPQSTSTLLERGILYRALSVVPNLKPELLRADQIVANDTVNLQLPPLSERTVALAESIVEGATNDYDKAARIERFLLTNYNYELNVKPLPAGREATDYFLFEQQSGYCAHFASAMAVMARQIGLPARVAGGYLPGIIDPLTGAHIVRAGDAHAWVEIHFQRYGWVAFDPTPRPRANLGFASGRNWVYIGLQDFTGATFPRLPSSPSGSLSLRWLTFPAWSWLILLGIMVLSVILVLFVRRLRMRNRIVRPEYSTLEGEARRATLRLYGKMVRMLTGKGVPRRQSHQAMDEYGALVCQRLPAGQEVVTWLTGLANTAAYDPRPFTPPGTGEIKSRLTALKKALANTRR